MQAMCITQLRCVNHAMPPAPGYTGRQLQAAPASAKLENLNKEADDATSPLVQRKHCQAHAWHGGGAQNLPALLPLAALPCKCSGSGPMQVRYLCTKAAIACCSVIAAPPPPRAPIAGDLHVCAQRAVAVGATAYALTTRHATRMRRPA